MEPIPETLAAINELHPAVDDVALLEQLTAAAERARTIAPDCVGVSVAFLDVGVTFTLVATSDKIALVDAVQYLAGGPRRSRSTKVSRPPLATPSPRPRGGPSAGPAPQPASTAPSSSRPCTRVTRSEA